MRALATIRALLLACTLVACGGSRGTQVTVNTTVDIHILIEPTPNTLPFDPRGARLLVANRELTTLIGHGLDVRIDAALAADLRSEFERQLIVAMEDLLRGLSDLRDTDSAEFVRTAKELTRVECRYSVLAEHARATFEGNTLKIEQPAHITRLAPAGAVREALDAREEAWLDAHFERVELRAISGADEAAYFRWLTRTRPGYGSIWEMRHSSTYRSDSTVKISENPHAEVIARVVSLHAKVDSDHSALANTVRAWLFEQLAWLTNQYQSNRESWHSMGNGTAMRRGELALCGWLQEKLPHANADERLLALNSLFVRDVPDAYPGVDRFAFGLAEADAWIAAGKPSEGGETSQAKLMDEVVCPSVREADGNRQRSRSCRHDWLLYAISDANNRKKLAAALDTRDPELTEQLFASLRYSSFSGTNALFRLLNPKRPAFSAALKTFAEVLANDQGSAVVDTAKVLWREQPDRRGDVLYILARAQGHDRTLSDYAWGRFQEQYGEPIRERDLQGFLEHGVPAFEFLPPMWPAIAKGFSRTKPVVERLAILLPDASQPAASKSISILSSMISRLCEDKASADLDTLHRALDSRVAAHPPERTALLTLLHDSGPGGCVAGKKSESK